MKVIPETRLVHWIIYLFFLLYGYNMYIPGTTCVYTGYHMCIYRVPNEYLQGTTCAYPGYHMCMYKVSHVYIQGTACVYTGYHMCTYNVPHVYIQGTTCAQTRYHMCIRMVPHDYIQGNTCVDTDVTAPHYSTTNVAWAVPIYYSCIYTCGTLYILMWYRVYTMWYPV
jgi:hypothetical protein